MAEPLNKDPGQLVTDRGLLPTNRRVVLQARLIGEHPHHASWLQLAARFRASDHPSTDRVKVFGKYLGRTVGPLPSCRDGEWRARRAFLSGSAGGVSEPLLCSLEGAGVGIGYLAAVPVATAMRYRAGP